jgi:hypothetical protein
VVGRHRAAACQHAILSSCHRSREQNPADILLLLRKRGAPGECIFLAEDAALDGRRLPLDEAVAAVVGRGMGAFISCVPGRLAYFEGEDPSERCILERADPHTPGSDS